MTNLGDKVGFIWSVADLLRGPYKAAQYKEVVLPLTVLRRRDCVLEPIRRAANASSLENFRYVFTKALEGLFIDRMEQNEEIFAK